jgi:16S rRNA (uracil1498-N3)-methyltransferase
MTETESGALPISLLFAPIKRPRLKILVEKITEIGVASIVPVTTMRTVSVLESAEELRATAVEASEQCERLTIPALLPVLDLGKIIKAAPTLRTGMHSFLAAARVDRLFVCCERSTSAQPIQNALQHWRPRFGERLGILVGPEGGFTEEEMTLFDLGNDDEGAAGGGSDSVVKKVSLGQNVLRSETAALFAVSCVAACLQSSATVSENNS